MTGVRVRVLGIGMGPQHVTAEVAEALRSADYVVAPQKSTDDPLLAVRRVIAAQHGLELVVVPDPGRIRHGSVTDAAAVEAQLAARVGAYEQVLRERGGTAAFLVWGDPSLYDSTLGIVERLAERLPLDYDVLPGVSAPQLLAARHRVPLPLPGQPVHITPARLLQDAVAAGQTNIVVMLAGSLDLSGLDDWWLWWGGNLGTPSEELVAGRVREVAGEVDAARERLRATAGWVLDVGLLRRVAP